MDAVDLDVLRTCAAWQKNDCAVLLVTVVRTWGSSPRPVGAMMALRDDGQVAGSVSGGCIEDDLIAMVQQGGIAALVPDGLPRSVTYGVKAEEAHKFGLPCGGTLQLVLEPLGRRSAIGELVSRISARQLTRRRLAMDTGIVELGDVGQADALSFDGRSLDLVLGAGFRLLVIGAGQLSRYLCETARGLGFDVTVCDPRGEYMDVFEVEGITLLRCMPDDAVQDMKLDERCAVIALTHDPKLDDLALLDALKTPAFYVGALGSRVNNAQRRERLKEHFGLAEGELAGLRGPAGIYIGSRTPPEIALSILAEIVAVKNGVEIPRLFAIAGAKEAKSLPSSLQACAV
jgi:xanthine dehydrogenase accessory factor